MNNFVKVKIKKKDSVETISGPASFSSHFINNLSSFTTNGLTETEYIEIDPSNFPSGTIMHITGNINAQNFTVKTPKLNAWKIVKDHLTGLKINQTFYRQDLVTKYRVNSTLDNYINLLRKAKFIKRVGRGRYIKLLDVPSNMKIKELEELILHI
mgnify:CR=1 FL=1